MLQSKGSITKKYFVYLAEKQHTIFHLTHFCKNVLHNNLTDKAIKMFRVLGCQQPLNKKNMQY